MVHNNTKSAFGTWFSPRGVGTVGSRSDSEVPSIETCTSIHEVFHSLVSEATQTHHYQPTSAASAYVTSVLVDYAHPTMELGAPTARPLSVLLVEALSVQGAQRFAGLRALGDGVLYFAGFFSECQLWHEVDRGYAQRIGARAYSEAAAMLRFATGQADEQRMPDLFTELSEEFGAFVGLVRAVAEMLLAHAHKSDAAVLTLYERWLSSGSQALAEALAREGVLAVRPMGGGTYH
jgi:hypothetical protein